MYPGVELRLCRYVVILAEELNYGRAAQRLHTAQPSLSKQILRLEHDLGFKLFRRNRRWVEVTPAGRTFVEEARKAPPLRWAGRSGQVRPTFKSSNTAEIIAKLLSHEWHAGLVVLPVVESELTVTPLLQEPVAIALPEAHRLASKRQIGLRDLRNESLILPPRRFNPDFHDYLLAQFRSKEFTPTIAQEVMSPHEVLHLVSEAAGVALAQASLLTNHRKGVIVKQLADNNLTVQVGLAIHRDNDSAILTAFRDAVAHTPDTYIGRAERISSKSA